MHGLYSKLLIRASISVGYPKITYDQEHNLVIYIH